MKRRMHFVAAVVGIALVSGTAAFADRGGGGHDDRDGKSSATRIFTLDPSTHGNPEGVAAKDHGRVFFVGATRDGTIYRGTIDSPTVTEFIPGELGEKSAIGLKVAGNKLYVAGGMTGDVLVYNLATKQVVASFETGEGGFLNDLVVTRKGDVFVTDSFRPTLWRITARQVRAGSGVPEGIPVEPEIKYESGQFNLNGIVARRGGKQLIVVQSVTGALFRIDLDDDAPNGRTIRQIDADPLVGGDGLLLDGGRLIVVQGGPPAALKFLKLKGGATRAEVVDTRTDPSLRGPSTVDRARNLYLVVNADFAMSRTPFTVSGLPRRGGD
jgi:DNA-binding beta-propeller fold protein YncE